MKVEETYISVFEDSDFKSKGVVFEAETKEDAELIEYVLENKETILFLIHNQANTHQYLKDIVGGKH